MGEKNHGSDKFLFFLAGAGIGAVVALLLAPKSGRETRELITRKATDSRDFVTNKVTEGRQLVEGFMKETREMMVPVRSIAENLRIASANLVEIGLAARDQFRRVEAMVTDTGEALHVQIERFDHLSQNMMDRINETASIVQDS